MIPTRTLLSALIVALLLLTGCSPYPSDVAKDIRDCKSGDVTRMEAWVCVLTVADQVAETDKALAHRICDREIHNILRSPGGEPAQSMLADIAVHECDNMVDEAGNEPQLI